MIAVRLPSDIEERLDTLAKETGRTKTWYVKQAIINQLEDLEDYQRAENAYREFLAGDQKTYTSEELRARLGL